jgi:hypothetical protein
MPPSHAPSAVNGSMLLGGMPRVAPTVPGTRAASIIVDRPMNQTPSGQDAPVASAVANATVILPMPPGLRSSGDDAGRVVILRSR